MTDPVPQRQTERDATRGFRRVYARHYGFVWHALRRLGVRAASVDDAVQDVFVAAYRRRSDFDGASTKAWLYAIARRVASNYRRSKWRTERRIEAIRGEASRLGGTSSSGVHAAVHALDRYLGTLGPKDREIYIMSELEGMTGPEIATARGANLSTVYSRIRKLRSAFEARAGGPETLRRARQSRPRATPGSWLLLQPALAKSASGTARWGTLWGASKIASAAAVLAVGVAVATPSAPATADAATPPHVDAGHGAAAPADRAPGVLTDHSADSPPAQSVETAVAVAPAMEPNRDAQPRARAGRRRPAPPAAAPVKGVRDGLQEENLLLNRAVEEMRRGSALKTTSTHATRFPTSALSDMRTAIRIEALCAIGKAQQARAQARIFILSRGNSALVERVRRICNDASQIQTDADIEGA